jgi:tRNA threonylcarbamoyladenosine biosynthesis protein TsaB
VTGTPAVSATTNSLLTLGIDTSTPVTSAALVRGQDLVATFQHAGGTAHGEVLAPGIESLLADAGVRPAQVVRVVVGVGPGPFTGLRVGVVTATVFAHSIGAELVGVCSLDALSLQVSADAFAAGGWLLVGSDARRREVYVAGYDRPGRRTFGPEVMAPAAARERAEDIVASLPGRSVRFVGAGAAAAPDVFGKGVPALTPEAASLATGVNAARLLPMPVHPLYLRPADAVVSAGATPVLPPTDHAGPPGRPDVATAVAFDRDVFGADAWSETVWAETLASPHRRVLLHPRPAGVAVERLTGMAVVTLTGADAELERIAVRPDARRAGHGRRLLDAAVAEARSAGASRLVLEVATDNVAALALYRSAGARELTVRAGYYADGTDAAVLAIDLGRLR